MNPESFKRLAPMILVLFMLLAPAGCVKKPVDKQNQALSEQPADAPEVAIAPEDASGLDAVEQEAAEALALAEDGTPLTPQEEEALESEPEISFDLGQHDTKEVRSFFKYFTHHKKGRKNFERWLERSAKYLPYVRRVFAERGLPHDLVYLPFVESGYNPRAGSRAGAKGMWQFMPYTGRKFGLEVGWWVDERYDPYKATHAAADYLTVLHEEFGDWYLALAAYNAGEGRVGRAIKKSGCEDFFELSQMKTNRWRRGRRLYYLPKETRLYVPKLLAVIKIVQNLESLGFKPLDWSAPDTVAQVNVPPRTDLREVAKVSGLSWQQFKDFNPAYAEPGSHPNEKSTVYVPTDKAEAAQAYLASAERKEYKAYYSFYKVRKGDSWYRISRRFGVPIAVLKGYNNKRSNLLRPGQSLKIPGKGETRLTAAQIKSQRKARSKNATNVLAGKVNTKGQYVVGSGDSLWSIAKAHKTTVSKLAAANGLSSKARLRMGQTLTIPGGKTLAIQTVAKATQPVTADSNVRQLAQSRSNYVVHSGDSLWSVAKHYGTTVGTLAKANGLSSRSSLKIGQRLYIPDQSSTATLRTAEQAEQAKQVITYKVRRGDTLYAIAKRFRVSEQSIRQWNGMDSSRIYPGDKLKLYQ
ncbi:LysM peptidoglycan-binding domain-containing protein [Desulfovibrio ferrophilus]|uniref:Lytic transglycosylase catalytic n=1 Tax=Desulfovibrio ferrophilus TaxID=241368 RepID=A0A2Z6B1U6_9BACT|nr:LysM peptidoglycan-binding domain-containing protein [Desulfovibrio ferrophilus]BBD09451.1 lytic transglycosylase catalytic [Desulfovibrio ferrophilus]